MAAGGGSGGGGWEGPGEGAWLLGGWPVSLLLPPPSLLPQAPAPLSLLEPVPGRLVVLLPALGSAPDTPPMDRASKTCSRAAGIQI